MIFNKKKLSASLSVTRREGGEVLTGPSLCSPQLKDKSSARRGARWGPQFPGQFSNREMGSNSCLLVCFIFVFRDYITDSIIYSLHKH